MTELWQPSESPRLRPLGDIRFELISDDSTSIVALPVVSRRGDLWQLSMDPARVRFEAWIKRPMWVRVLNERSQEVYKTTVRLTGLLDQFYADPKRPLGLEWISGKPALRVWAPTAQKVELLRYESSWEPPIAVHAMTEESQGFWSLTGEPSWNGHFYKYRVTAFSPANGRIETHEVTDPASVSLSRGSERSQIVNLNDESLMPPNWKSLAKPALERPTDAVLYEMHVRDFTTGDPALSPLAKGKYLGLVHPSSRAYAHLRDLAKAGLTHVHLLPMFDFAGVPELNTIAPLAESLAPSADSSSPQEEIGKVRYQDPYNWGYNPVHWMVPEGSYSNQPDGPERIREMRLMMQRLNQIGLRVVFDVVFNHTYASGLEDYSVFDRIVPYYYHRYNERGELLKSSCCADVATENIMVEKLVIDSLVFLAKTYKIDGFRFDLMNLHPRTQVARIRDALAELTLRRDGVEGSKILIYAEAWPFGSLEDTAPGSSFTQLRSAGLGVGVFNDRFRDVLRGGTTDNKEKSDQGFATGLYWDFNQEPANTNTPIDRPSQRGKLLHYGDIVKVGLMGNLRDFIVRDHLGNQVRAGDLNYRGVAAGYAAEPMETITYVSAHDGYCLWDTVQAKLPFRTPGRSPMTASREDRVRVQKFLLGTAAVAQGIPFFEGGAELLRSKSGDVDSYDSGDWFNRIDLSYASNNWGVGLPPAWKNLTDWPFWQPRLVDPALQVLPADIASTNEHFKALLRLRRAQPLLRLSTASEIKQNVSFPMDEDVFGDKPGLVVMLIQDKQFVDPRRRALVVVLNAATETQSFRSSSLAGRQWRLPPEFDASVDSELARVRWNNSNGKLEIPARSIVVLEDLR